MKPILRISFILLLLYALPRATFSQWGIEIGGTYNIQSGTFVAPCGCTFADGRGFGYNVAVPYNLISFLGFSIGVIPGGEFQRFTSYEVDPHTLAHLTGGDTQEVSLDYFTVAPYLRYTFPFIPLFLQVAPEFQYEISSEFQHIGYEPSGISPDTSLNVRSQRYTAALSVGYSFPLLAFNLAPMITAEYPLTDLRLDKASNWKVTTLELSLAVFF